ncbi:MAG: TonB family protein [Proteobacteria bacterium]|nr:TonB family protein [Pseudomonadota bacterium]
MSNKLPVHSIIVGLTLGIGLLSSCSGSGSGSGSGSFHGRANVAVPSGDPAVSGGLSAEEILQIVRANLNQIVNCYDQLLQRSPSAAGKLAVDWSINAQGGVSSVSIAESSISDSQMKGCVTSSIKLWKFPAPRGGQAVQVTFPFTFNPD